MGGEDFRFAEPIDYLDGTVIETSMGGAAVGKEGDMIWTVAKTTGNLG